jgi:hypothetical protein
MTSPPITRPAFLDRLQDGLLLERANVVLPWQAKRSVIATLGAPACYEAGDRAIYSWHERVLDGFDCTMQFPFIRYEPDAFDKAYIELAGEDFARVVEHLARVLGDRPRVRTADAVAYVVPHGRIEAHVWEHFDLRCTLTIAPA